MIFFCSHKWGKVNDKGYQYCTKCNKANYVGLPECQHKWDIHNTFNLTVLGSIKAVKYVLRCSICGDMKNHLMDMD